jgi:hypothetical protein
MAGQIIPEVFRIRNIGCSEFRMMRSSLGTHECGFVIEE